MFPISDRLARSLIDDSLFILNDLQQLSVCVPLVTSSDQHFLGKAYDRYVSVWKDVDERMLMQTTKCPTGDETTDTTFYPTDRKRECDRCPKTCQTYDYGQLQILLKSTTIKALPRAAAVNIMALLRLFAPDGTSRFLVSYCASTARKMLPEGWGEALDVSHVNSGFTMRNRASSSIMVWRSEEHLKVLLHEIIHCIGADDLHIDENDVQTLKKLFNLDQRRPLLLEETYTEVLALLYHCFFVSLYTETSLMEILEIERRFAVLQACKLLKHFGIESSSEIFRNTRTMLFKEKTNAFCYHILKCAILFDLAPFLELIRQNDSFVSSSYQGNQFVHLIKQACHNAKFQAAVDSLLVSDYLARLEPFTKNTLRMTALEIKQ